MLYVMACLIDSPDLMRIAKSPERQTCGKFTFLIMLQHKQQQQQQQQQQQSQLLPVQSLSLLLAVLLEDFPNRAGCELEVIYQVKQALKND